jgi:hypothetical protein
MPPAALSEGIKEREGKPAAAVDHAMATPDEPLSALSLLGRAGPERYRKDRADDAADYGRKDTHRNAIFPRPAGRKDTHRNAIFPRPADQSTSLTRLWRDVSVL